MTRPYIRRWNDSNVPKLKEWYGKKPTEELAKELGMPIYIIQNKARKFGLRFPHGLDPKIVKKRNLSRKISIWKNIRSRPEESEQLGKQWLARNGFEYVNYFADYENKNTGHRRRNFPFDYYAERNGEKWFIDATVNTDKTLDVPITTIFLKFAKIGVLFVGKKNSYLREVPRPIRDVKLSHAILSAIAESDTKIQTRAMKGDLKAWQ